MPLRSLPLLLYNMSAPLTDLNPVEDKAVSIPSPQASDEKIGFAVDDAEIGKEGALDTEIKAVLPLYDDDNHKDSQEVIIITGADVSTHLLPLRDDGEPALTFRGVFLATCLSAFQAVMTQIYTVS